jgi:hypothetical protein
MAESIGNYSPPAVIEAIERNLTDSSTALGRSEDGIVYHGSDVTWVYTGHRTMSRVLGARFTSEDVQDRVAQIHGYFKQWDAGVSWVVGPSSYPPALGDYLDASGFGISESWMGMAMDLSDLKKYETPKRLQIQKVDDEAGFRTWATFWENPACENLEGAINVFSPDNAGSDPHCKYYLGRVNDKPVARAMTFRRDDVVGLYWIATLKEHNDQSFSAAMAHQAMQDAAAAGAKTAVMAVSTTGQNFCEKLGFKPYCQFNVYNWPRSPQRPTHC